MANLFTKIDLEGGNTSQFSSTSTGTNYALTVVAGAAKNGSYGARAAATSNSDTNTSAKGIKTFTASGAVTVVDCEMRFSSWTGDGYEVDGSKAIMLLNASGVGAVAWLGVHGTRTVELCYRNTGFSEVSSGLTLAMTLNTWYRLRIIHNKSAGSLVFKRSTDGGANWTTVGTVSSGVRADNIDEVHTGVVHINNWEAAQYTVDFDDLEAWDAEPAGGSAPNAPTLNSATAGNAQVALSWSPPGTGATPTGYKVKRGTSTGSYSSTTDVGNVTSYNATGLTNGQVYYFQIVAYNAVGDGTGSNEMSATPAAPPTPGAPTLSSAVAGNTQVVLTWTASSNSPTGYKVKRGTATGVYGTTIDVGAVLTYTNTGLSNGTQYFYQIVGYNASGDGTGSNELNATPTAGPPPSAPTLVALVPGSTTLTASWNSVPGATGYKVRIGTAHNTYGAATDVGNVLTTQFTGLTNGTTYYVIVIAYSGNGDSANSNELSSAPSATSILQTKYNDAKVGDVFIFEDVGMLEAMSVGTHPTPDSGHIYKTVTGGYEFAVSRNLDGTGKNDWVKGKAYMNTGAPGDGFIDIYSYRSILAQLVEFISVNGATAGDAYTSDFPILQGANTYTAFGLSAAKWDSLFLEVRTPAVYTSATIVYEYWNGSSWATLSGATVKMVDANNTTIALNDYKTAGTLSIVFTAPGNWATTTLAGQSAYWIRIRCSAASGWTQNPKQGYRYPVRGRRQYGPSIVFWRRYSTTWNDLKEAGVVGNLEGFYDYGTPMMGAAFGNPLTTWLSLDSVNGMRMMTGSSIKGQIKVDGTWRFNGDANQYIDWNGSTLTVAGAINVISGSVPWNTLTGVPGPGVNLLPNPLFEGNTSKGWGSGTHNSFSPACTNISFGVNYPTWCLPSISTVYINLVGGATSGNYGEYYSDLIPALAGESFEFSCYTGAHRSKAQIYLLAFDSAGAYLAWYAGDTANTINNAESQGGTTLASYKRLWGIATLPANTAYVRLYMRAFAPTTGNADSWGFFAMPFVGRCVLGQTQPSPFSSSDGRGMFSAVSGAGLYISPTNFGYYSGGYWRTSINSSGDFFFRGAPVANAPLLQWDATNGQLSGGYYSGANYAGYTQQWYTDSINGAFRAGGAQLNGTGLEIQGEYADSVGGGVTPPSPSDGNSYAATSATTNSYKTTFTDGLGNKRQGLKIGYTVSQDRTTGFGYGGKGIVIFDAADVTSSTLNQSNAQVSGTVTNMYLFKQIAYFYGGIDTNGLNVRDILCKNTAAKPGGGTWAASSDERVKVIKGAYKGGLKEVRAIEPIVYTYNGRGDTIADGIERVGVVAQKMKEIMPATVREVASGDLTDMLMFDSSDLIFALINAVKELSSEVDRLKLKAK